ncbi:hypothetical protein CEP51_015119 [Fusarium floridanum]|uniref:Uncharacterized protein n=1 Tax=Fusarium floridanum TaxID=1325733 RepID=A0A428PGA3_9HYPO|nr:hypothetical protein CEP51_015119 [Fusarium floridanum]
MLRCQTCSRSFLKTADLHEHVESFKARARDLTIELLQCLAHATSLTGGVLESARDEGNDFNIDSHDDIGGIDDDDENKEEDSVGFGSDRSDDKDGDDEDGNGFEIDENNRYTADVRCHETGLSPPRKRSKTQTHNSVIRSPSGILVTESDDTNDPMVEAGIIVQQSQEIPQQLTNPGELIDAGTVHLPISGIPTDAMVMHQGFITPPGPSRGSIFGSQNVGYPFVEESHSEARGALFYASRLSGSWSHTDYQFPDGSLPTMALEPQGNDILATEEMMTCDGTIVRGVAANVYK